MRVLVVDDDEIFSEILANFLESKQCLVTCVYSLEDAEQLIAESNYDIYLIDSELKDGLGAELVPVIKAKQTKRPCIMVTADDTPESITHYFKIGVDDYALKPVSVVLLWQKIIRCRTYYQKEEQLIKQRKKLELLIAERQHQENLAQHVFSTISTRQNEVDKNWFSTHVRSSDSFNGDFFYSTTAPNGSDFLFMADGTGHGLAAAISVLPLLTTFKGMVNKGFPLEYVLHEANKKVNEVLPDDRFICLTAIEVNPILRRISVFNAGMPDIVLMRHNATIELLPSKSLALGILNDGDFEANIAEFDLSEFKHITFYSDGLIEQENKYRLPFTAQRVYDIITHCDQLGEPVLPAIVSEFERFLELVPLSDDLSLCHVDLVLFSRSLELRRLPNTAPSHSLVNATFELCGDVLSSVDIVDLVDQVLRSLGVVGEFRQRVFTVAAEMIINALEHGVLKLNSNLKNDIEGFGQFLEEKEARLRQIKPDDFIKVHMVYDSSLAQVKVTVTDCGEGYVGYNTSLQEVDKLSGRGLALIKHISDEFSVISPGNSAIATISRGY